MNEGKIFIKLVKLTSNKEAFLKTQWTQIDEDKVKVNFQICITEDQSIFAGSEEFEHQSNADEYISFEKSLKLRSSDDCSENVQFNLDEKKMRFTVTKKASPSQSTDLILMKRIEVRQVSAHEVSSMYLECIQEQSKLLELQSRLDEKDRLIVSLNSSNDEFISKSRDYEEKFLPGVLRLLNSKKNKIQQLENEILKLKQDRGRQSPSSVKPNVPNFLKTPERTASSRIPDQTTPRSSSTGWISTGERKSSVSPVTSKSPQKSLRKRTPQKPIEEFSFVRTNTRSRKLKYSEELVECGEASTKSKNITSPEKSTSATDEDKHSQKNTDSILSDKFRINLGKRHHPSNISSQSSNDSESSQVKRGRHEDENVPDKRSTSNDTATKSSDYQTPPDYSHKDLKQSEEIFSQSFTQDFEESFEIDDGANVKTRESASNPVRRSQRRNPLDYSIFNADTQDFDPSKMS